MPTTNNSAEQPAEQGFRVRRREPNYPLGVPSKFDPDGNVQPFAGNTIVAHLPPSDKLYNSLLSLHAKLAASSLAHLFALLPPPSWHMTVFEGVCDQVRMPGLWPSDLPLNAPLEQVTAHFAEKLAAFEFVDGEQLPYRLTVTGFSPLFIGIGVSLRLRTPEEEAGFRGLRDRLSKTLLIRAPHHDNYGLHLSLAYFLRYPDEQQKAELLQLLTDHLNGGMAWEFELGAPEFCTYENMYRFDRLSYLGGASLR
ncbi:RNA ligase/cyclic nucleotide phosphodiesterase [Lasiosphaeria hispida]|uniref:RNA ligase/cyclic nucleotide phosphodiesterase n=1 Tax=Lasiosphaeria hispida TaxID=260671 RepID=A0AAJ0HT54_9PEZI|nr:RNA ligase/cyclic nucleotide phosphodiesterase [Lasiosphaeria hispida]